MYVRWELGGVVALAAPLFIVRHVYVQNLRLQQASRELLELMVKQIEARDPYTSGSFAARIAVRTNSGKGSWGGGRGRWSR